MGSKQPPRRKPWTKNAYSPPVLSGRKHGCFFRFQTRRRTPPPPLLRRESWLPTTTTTPVRPHPVVRSARRSVLRAEPVPEERGAVPAEGAFAGVHRAVSDLSRWKGRAVVAFASWNSGKKSIKIMSQEQPFHWAPRCDGGSKRRSSNEGAGRSSGAAGVAGFPAAHS